MELRAACASCAGSPTIGHFHVPQGTTLCLEGDPAESVYGLLSGYVRETRSLPDGRVAGLRVAGPGTVLGTDAIRTGVYGCTVETLTAASVCAVTLAELSDRTRALPAQGAALARLLATEIEELRTLVVRLECMTAEERVLSMLETMAADHQPGAWYPVTMSREELAAHLGLAMETVSRTFSRLAKRGLIEVRGRRVRLVPAAGQP